MTPTTSLELTSITLAGSASAAAVGWTVVRAIRRKSLQLQLVVIGLSTVLTSCVGVSLAANRMFVSGHDSQVLAVVLVVSAAAAILASWFLGRAFSRSVATVGNMAVGLLKLNQPVEAPQQLVTKELRSLAGELQNVAVELESSRQRERSLDAARRELVAWVSHDLRSPIAAIRAMSEALEDGVVDDDLSVTRYHRAIRQESERLGLLVDDLFELSRISAGVVDAKQIGRAHV